jgi:hypothetical protein
MDNNVQKVRGRMEVSGITGPLWFWGWLFTIGFVHLSFWKGALALIIWPYYLGVQLASKGVVG